MAIFPILSTSGLKKCKLPNIIDVNSNGIHLFFTAIPIPCIKYPLKKYSSKLVCNGIKTIAIKNIIEKDFHSN